MTGEEPIQEQVELQFVADTRLLQTELNIAAGVGRRFASSLLRAFDGLANKGKSLGQVLRGLALDLSKLVLKAAFKPLQSGLGALFQGLFTGGAAFGSGGVLQQGTPVPFAKGGVIAAPAMFPLAGGRTGLMGERGAEAIMPLARDGKGRLGVVASGGGSGAPVVHISVQAKDVESFRRSETQVAAVLSRALAMGQRNL